MNKPMVFSFLFYLGLILLWVIAVVFQNTGTVSGKWIYETFRVQFAIGEYGVTDITVNFLQNSRRSIPIVANFQFPFSDVLFRVNGDINF